MTAEIRLLEAGDRVTGLSVGNDSFVPLKTFLQRDAKGYQTSHLARTYIAVAQEGPRSGKVIGYISLCCAEVVIGDDDPALVDDEDLRYNFKHYPSVKIARLLVDTRARGMKIGSTLVDLAVATTNELIGPFVGCRFLMVDAKRDSVSFYEKCGFTLLDTAANRARQEQVMFIDMAKL